MKSLVLLWVTLASLVLLTTSAKGVDPIIPNSKPAATINGEPIMMSEVEAFVRQRFSHTPAPSEVQRRQRQMDVMAFLIDDILMRQYLRQTRPQADANEVAKRLAELESGLKAQNQTLRDFLRETGQTEEQLRADAAAMLQWAKYLKETVTEAELKRFYEENRDFFDQVTVRASHILIRVAANSSEKDRQAAQAKLAGIRDEMGSGKLEFAEAAKKYSQCTSAPKGGDIGYFPRKWAVDERIAKAAFALKVGEVSDVIQTDFGLHLITVTDRRPGPATTFEKMRDEVRETFAVELRSQLLMHQRKLAKIEILLPEANPSSIQRVIHKEPGTRP